MIAVDYHESLTCGVSSGSVVAWQVVDQRLWPRAAAMAERLWSDPEEDWKAAEHRFLYHRERLVDRGTPADTIEPLWCLQNQGSCYL